MNRPARRSLLVLSTVLAGLVLAACTGVPGTPEKSPVPSPATTGTPEPTATPAPTVRPVEGNVDRTYPELSVELAGGYLVSVTDPAAKAWRVELRGTGDASGDRLEVVVEVGDVAPAAEARLYAGGRLIDTIEMGGMVGLDTAAAGGCHPTLGLCIGSGTIAIDPAAGRVTVLVEAPTGAAIDIIGATADWPGEPFILGPWQVTEPFTSA